MEVASHVVNSPAPPPSFTGPGVSDSSSTGTGSTPASELALGSTTASTMTTATTTSASPTLNMGMPPNNSAVMMQQQYHGMKADDPSMTVSVGAPTSINTSLASASSAMTPTTVNFAMNAQLAKSTGTLTPMGEDKVSTAGPVAVQKAKQSKKKANADGEAPKKPSPRVRTPATKSEKAEKRKASPSRGSGVDTPTGNGMASVPASNGQSMGQPPAQPASQPAGPLASNPTYASMSDNSTNSYDTPPAQDIELRKLFLQKIYRQLQMTHRNQDDLTVRRIATNIEMEICRRASDRNEYVMLVQQQVNSLMQAELTNGNVGNQASVYAPGQNPSAPGVTAAMSHPSQTNGAMPTRPGGQHGQGNSYGQNVPSVPSAPEMNQRGSSGGQGSFMSLLSSQAPVQSQDSMRPQTQFMAQPRPPQYANIPPNYAPPSDTMAGQTGPMESQSGLTNQNIPGSFPPQRAQVSSSSTSAPPEFAAQFQRLDRTGLVDLLWTQHRTLLQYQRRMAQIEVQLNGRQQSPGVGVPANAMPPSAPANPNGYYNHVPPHQPPTTAGVPSTLSAEAEAQRTLDRRNSRAGQQQSQYPSGQVQTPYTANPVVVPPPSNVNPAVYWEKVRVLKDAFLRPLYIAHQALAQHNAPANSAQGVKAENVRHNIGLACSILSEPPKAHQPRPLEVLESIERFILSTVVPIVKKVYPQGDTASPPATTEATTPHQLRPPQHQSTDYADPSRNSLGSSQSTGHSTSHMAIPQNGESTPSNSVPPLAPSSAPPKSGAKAAVPKTKSTARKSPTNGQKKATAPKSSTPKTGAKSGGKKNNAKSSGKQPPNGTAPQNPEGMVEQQRQGPSSVEEAQPTNEGVDPPKSGAIADDDSLNDFSDFADLDFGDDLQDPLSKVQNKENSTEPNARKRSFEDV